MIEIATAADLAKIGNDPEYPLNGEYVQTADIAGVTSQIAQFDGTYNGNGYGLSFSFSDGTVCWILLLNGTIRRVNCQGSISNGSEDVSSLVYQTGTTGRISDCFSSMALESTDSPSTASGIVAYTISGAVVNNCLFVGTLAAGGGTYGIGQGSGITNCYYDKTVQAGCADEVARGLTTAQLKAALPAGFDPSIWKLTADGPRLRTPADMTTLTGRAIRVV